MESPFKGGTYYHISNKKACDKLPQTVTADIVHIGKMIFCGMENYTIVE